MLWALEAVQTDRDRGPHRFSEPEWYRKTQSRHETVFVKIPSLTLAVLLVPQNGLVCPLHSGPGLSPPCKPGVAPPACLRSMDVPAQAGDIKHRDALLGQWFPPPPGQEG